ncbi:MAG: NAD(P)-dependent oxidoreductase [Spirochaetaceae bacterium]|jgi:nucleoside-diphosphate-sugar epimerase|nr:NAD(P)-dependent oxidoreductase [Spirochaetaceae bacterium]
MKKIIVSGASGLVGKAFCEYMLKAGFEVYGIARGPEKLKSLTYCPAFHPVKLDFSQYENIDKHIEIRRPDAFVHLAWNGVLGERDNYRLQIENITASADAAKAAAELKAGLFLFVGSAAEQNVSINSAGMTGPCNHYGAAKAAAQKFCRIIAHESAMNFVGVSLANVISPPPPPVLKSDKSATNIIIRKMLAGERVDLIEGGRLHDFIYIDDAVAGIYAAMNSGRSGETYYLGGNRLRPFRDFIVEMKEILGSNSELCFGAFNDTSFIDYSGIHLYKLYEHTGFRPRVEFGEGIRITARHIREN